MTTYTYRPDHNGECLNCDEPLDAHLCPDLTSRLLDMVERVEWVRASSGQRYVCPFCHAVTERDGGPGHTDDCEWVRVSYAGSDLREKGILR